MSLQKYILEIATSDYTTTKSAVEGGADRIELCSNLFEGGTTASYGQLKRCRDAFPIPIYPIIRPRGGDFLYAEEEFAIMLADAKMCKDLNYDGIVTGLLLGDGRIDLARTTKLIKAVYPLELTFHRAFDRCRDPFEAMEQLIEIGCERILTSGQQPAAPNGIDLIAQLNKAADGRIIIMPGSGIRKENARMIAEKTGCTEFHSSLRGKTASKMNFIHSAFASSEESYQNNSIDAAEVRILKEYLLK